MDGFIEVSPLVLLQPRPAALEPQRAAQPAGSPRQWSYLRQRRWTST